MKDAMKKKSSPSFFGIGLSSILIIFVLLCLMVFAMLSLVSARAGRRLEDRLFGRASAYYEACARADSLLEEVDRGLDERYRAEPDSYADSASAFLGTLSGRTEDLGDALSFSFTESVDETQYLSVTVEIPKEPPAGERYYRITAWVTAPAEAWEPDEHLNVLD